MAGERKAGRWIAALGITLACAAAVFGPDIWRAMHPRPQVNVENAGPTPLIVVHGEESFTVEAGKTMGFREDAGGVIEVMNPGGFGLQSLKVVVPEAPDRRILTLEAAVDAKGVLATKWKDR